MNINKLNEALILAAKENGTLKFPVSYSAKFVNQTIDNLALDTRSYNALKRSKMGTIANALDNLENISEIKGCGSKTINRIKYQICCAYFEYLDQDKRKDYLKKILKLNNVNPDDYQDMFN